MALRVLLTGEDAFAIRERADFYLAAFKHKVPEGSIRRFDAEAVWSTVEAALLSQSLFAEKQMIVLGEYLKTLSAKEQKQFAGTLAALPEETSLLLLEPRVGRAKPVVMPARLITTEQFAKPTPLGRQQWLRAELKARHLNLPQLAPQLSKLAVEDPWLVRAELDKLEMASRAGANVLDIVSLPQTEKVFAITQAIERGDAKAVSAVLTRLERSTAAPIEALGYLASWSRQALLVKQESNPVGLTMPPFAVAKLRQFVSRLPSAVITRQFQAVVVLDERLKRGEWEGWPSLTSWCLAWITKITA